MGEMTDVWIRKSEKLISVEGPGGAYGILGSFLGEVGFKLSLVRKLTGGRQGHAFCTEVRLLDRRYSEGWDITGVWARWRAVEKLA